MTYELYILFIYFNEQLLPQIYLLYILPLWCVICHMTYEYPYYELLLPNTNCEIEICHHLFSPYVSCEYMGVKLNEKWKKLWGHIIIIPHWPWLISSQGFLQNTKFLPPRSGKFCKYVFSTCYRTGVVINFDHNVPHPSVRPRTQMIDCAA